MDNRPIGIFDSGVGGLSAVKCMLETHPEENIVYFGDTERVPYGNRAPEEIVSFSVQDMNFLRTFDLKAVLIACNTITVCSLGVLREQNPDIPVIGVVDAAAGAAVRESKSKQIGVIATQATIESGGYEKKITALSPDAKVTGVACPKFVPLIESGHISADDPELRDAVAEYCASLKGAVDTLILGCTHYPLIAEAVGNFMGGDVALIDSGAVSVNDVITALEEKNQLAGKDTTGTDHYFCSGDPAQFARIADMFLKKDISAKTMKVNIGRF